MTNEELITLAKTMLVENEVFIKEQGGETVNPGLMPKLIKSLEELTAENTRLRDQCKGIAQAAINNGQALIIAESKLLHATEFLNNLRDEQSYDGAELVQLIKKLTDSKDE